jgi:hypothetical protein
VSTVTVQGANPYDIVIGHGVREQLRERLGAGVAKVLLVHQPIMTGEATRIRENLLGQVDVLLAEVPLFFGPQCRAYVELVEKLWELILILGITQKKQFQHLGLKSK